MTLNLMRPFAVAGKRRRSGGEVNSPIAVIDIVAITDRTVSVSADQSFDPGGSIAGYEWDFGDGTPLVTDDPDPTHVYSTDGIFTITLTVTDDVGMKGSTTRTVQVQTEAPDPQDPIASFSFFTAGLTVTVNSGASSDPDGTIVSRAWTFGDGSTGSGTVVQHSYAAPGSYTVVLTVTDNDGRTGQATEIVSVSAPSAGQSPHRAFNRISYIDYGIHYSPNPAQLYDIAAARYDYVVNGNMNEWISRNPTIQYYKYDLFWQHRIKTNTGLDNWLPQNGYSVENAYLHAPSGVTIPAWNDGITNYPSRVSTGQKIFEDRWRSNQYGSDWYDYYNLADAGYKAWRLMRTAQHMAPNAQGYAPAGMFYDVSNTGTFGNTTKGIQFPVLEYSGATAHRNDYMTLIAQDVALTNSGHHLPNQAQAWNQANNVAAQVAQKGVMTEYVNNPYGQTINKWNLINQQMNQGVLFMMSSGVPTNNKNTTAQGGFTGTTPGNYNTNRERILIWEYVSYLMCVIPTLMDMLFVSFQLGSYNYEGIVETWIDAFDVDVGLPIGNRGVYSNSAHTGPDGEGQGTKVWTRDLENCKIFLRGAEGSGFSKTGDTTAIPVALPAGSTWRLLNADGTQGPSATTIQLRLSEAVIMMRS